MKSLSGESAALKQEVNRINVARAKLTAAILLVLELLMITAALLFELPAPELSMYYMGMYLFFLTAMAGFTAVFTVLGRNPDAHEPGITASGVLFSTLVLAWCGGIALLDQHSSGQIIVYTAAGLCIAAVPVFKLRFSLLVFIPVHVLFLLLLPRFQESRAVVFANMVNSSTFIAISVGISYLRYGKQVTDFRQRKLIREKSLPGLPIVSVSRRNFSHGSDLHRAETA